MAKERLIPCLIHVPCYMPDGSRVASEEMNRFLEMFDRQFGGSTVLGIVDGRWVSPEGDTVSEKMLRVEVSVKETQVELFEKVAMTIGRETQQKAMYVVINFESQTRILFSDDDEAEGGRTQVAT